MTTLVDKFCQLAAVNSRPALARCIKDLKFKVSLSECMQHCCIQCVTMVVFMLIFKHRPKYFEFMACVEKCDPLPVKTSDLRSPNRRKFLRTDTLVNIVKGLIVCSRYSCLAQ